MNVLFLINSLLFFSSTALAQSEIPKDKKDSNNAPIQNQIFKSIKWTLNENKTSEFGIGGEIRETYQFFSNENWGDFPEKFKDKDGYFLQRILFNTKINFDNKFKVVAQFVSLGVLSRAGGARGALDKDELDIQQLFVEWNILNSNTKLDLRLGRQEFNYGWENLISVREGPNGRQSFDALTFLISKMNINSELFYAKKVDVKQYVFDNDISNNNQIYGLYNTLPISKDSKTKLDIYYIGYTKNNIKLSNTVGNDSRNSFGFRVFNTKKSILYNVETIFQTGTLGDKKIRAYSSIAMLGYNWIENKFNPKISVFGTITSGDKNPNDNFVETFNPMYSRPAFPFALPLSNSNINNIQVEYSMHPTKKIKSNIGIFNLWRNTINDGLYTPSQIQIRTQQNDKSEITTLFYTNLEYLQNHFNYTLQLVYSKPKDYVVETGNGKDIFYVLAQINYKF